MLYMPCACALPSIFVPDGLLLGCFHASRNVVEQVKSFLLLTDDKKKLSQMNTVLFLCRTINTNIPVMSM